MAEREVERTVRERRRGVRADQRRLRRDEAAGQPALGEDDVDPRRLDAAQAELAQVVPDPAGELQHARALPRVRVEQREPAEVRRVGPAVGEVVRDRAVPQRRHRLAERPRGHRRARVVLRRPRAARPVVAVREQQRERAVLVAALQARARGGRELLAPRPRERDPRDDELAADAHARPPAPARAVAAPAAERERADSGPWSPHRPVRDAPRRSPRREGADPGLPAPHRPSRGAPPECGGDQGALPTLTRGPSPGARPSRTPAAGRRGRSRTPRPPRGP